MSPPNNENPKEKESKSLEKNSKDSNTNLVLVNNQIESKQLLFNNNNNSLPKKDLETNVNDEKEKILNPETNSAWKTEGSQEIAKKNFSILQTPGDNGFFNFSAPKVENLQDNKNEEKNQIKKKSEEPEKNIFSSLLSDKNNPFLNSNNQPNAEFKLAKGIPEDLLTNSNFPNSNNLSGLFSNNHTNNNTFNASQSMSLFGPKNTEKSSSFLVFDQKTGESNTLAGNKFGGFFGNLSQNPPSTGLFANISPPQKNTDKQ